MAVFPLLESEFVKNLELPSGDVVFDKTRVEKLSQARSCVFDDICRDIFVPHYTDIRTIHLISMIFCPYIAVYNV